MYGWDERLMAVFEDLNCVQALGGNISTKVDNQLFVKKSGTSLKKYRQASFWCSINDRHAYVNEVLHGVIHDQLVVKGKPSIEASMHAILTRKYVLHIHELFTLSALTQDLKHQEPTIQYVAPGVKISYEILKNRFENEEVIFLENHGIVIQGDSIAHILDLLKITVTKYKKLFRLDAEVIKYNKLQKHVLINLNLDHDITSNWRLYPDHVVTCGLHPNFDTTEIGRFGYAFQDNCRLLISETCPTGIKEQIYLYLNVLANSPVNSLRQISELEAKKLIERPDEVYRKAKIL